MLSPNPWFAILTCCAWPIAGLLTAYVVARKTRTRLGNQAWGFGILLGLATMALVYYAVYVPVDFYNNSGLIDTHMTPLVFPYRVVSIDSRSCGYIKSVYDDKKVIIGHVRYIGVYDSTIIGRTVTGCLTDQLDQWFILNAQSGQILKFETYQQEAYQLAVDGLGLGPNPSLEGVEYFQARYWDELEFVDESVK